MQPEHANTSNNRQRRKAGMARGCSSPNNDTKASSMTHAVLLFSFALSIVTTSQALGAPAFPQDILPGVGLATGQFSTTSPDEFMVLVFDETPSNEFFPILALSGTSGSLTGFFEPNILSTNQFITNGVFAMAGIMVIQDVNANGFGTLDTVGGITTWNPDPADTLFPQNLISLIPLGGGGPLFGVDVIDIVRARKPDPLMSSFGMFGTPEPASLSLLSFGAWMAFCRRRRTCRV